MTIRIQAGAIALALALGCAHLGSSTVCLEMILDDVAGASVLETWELARKRGWDCTVRPSIYVDTVRLECVDGNGPTASKLERGFARDQLVSATLERWFAAVRPGCAEQSLGFAGWADATLLNLRARFGPPQRTSRSDESAETYMWLAMDEEYSLEIDGERQRLAVSATDTARLRSLRLGEAELAYMIEGPSRDSAPEMRFTIMAEEVARNLRAIAGVESSYHAEFGRYVAAALHPGDVPRGVRTEWHGEQAGPFHDLGFAPPLGRVSCSYAVGLGPEPCSPENCQTFTAIATCDPNGDGKLVHWGLVQRSPSGVTTDGPSGICSASGVYSPDSGERIGHDIVGLCEASSIAPR